MMLRRQSLVQWIAAGALSFGAAVHTHATPMVDQQSPSGNFPFTVGTLSDGSLGQFQQGVTAGMEGLLAQIDLIFAGNALPDPPDTNSVDVRFFVNLGLPLGGGPLVFEETRAFEGQQPGDTVVLDLLRDDDGWGDIPVTTGDLFIIGLEPLTTSVVMPNFIGNVGGYPGGRLFIKGAPPQFDDIFDLTFTTYVGTRAAPEPGSLLLLVLGLSGLGVAQIRRPIAQPAI